MAASPMSYPSLDCGVPVSGERNTLRWKGKYIDGVALQLVLCLILDWIVVYSLCLCKEYTPLERLVYRWCGMTARQLTTTLLVYEYQP